MKDTKRVITLFEVPASGGQVPVAHRFEGTARATTSLLRIKARGPMREGDEVAAEVPEVVAPQVGSFAKQPTGKAVVMRSARPLVRVKAAGVATTDSVVRTDCEVQPQCKAGEIFQSSSQQLRIRKANVITGQ